MQQRITPFKEGEITMSSRSRRASLMLLSVSMAVVSTASTMQLFPLPHAIGESCSGQYGHGCWDADPDVPCHSTDGCTKISDLILQRTASCDATDPEVWQCDNANTGSDSYQATAVATWYSCHQIPDKNQAACNNGCLTCANVYNYSGSTCSAIEKCTKNPKPLPQCGAKDGPE